MAKFKPTLTHDDVEIFAEKNLYHGYAKVQQYQLRHKLFSGAVSQPFIRELLVRYNAVGVLPYDPKLDRVVLIEQFRIGALKEKSTPWLLELVAGVIDKNNSKKEIATLEVQEEAGLKVKKLIPIYEYLSSPGASSEKVTIYCALVDASNAGGIHGIADENEDIKVHTFSCEQAFEMVRNGTIDNAPTIIALQWLELRRSEKNLFV